MSRFAGQAVDITQFMPKDGPQYDMISDQVMATNSMLRNTGTAAQAQFNTAGTNAAATAQIGNLKGQMHITHGNLNATKILTGAEAAAAQLNAQGDVAQFGGMMEGLTGLAKGGLGFAENAGMFGGGKDILGTSRSDSTNNWQWDSSNDNYSEFNP
tara:strand:- start:359 stop:826 length:468 start_codon:yes stop_codon:yes gene_type:complete